MKKDKTRPTAYDHIGIYSIECVSSKSIYVGQSMKVNNRIRSHKRALKDCQYFKSNKKMQLDYVKYGESNFKFSIIMSCEAIDLLRLETFYIKYYSRMGYNMYNKLIDTKNHTIFNCPREYAELMNRILKGLQLGSIKKEDLEKGLSTPGFAP